MRLPRRRTSKAAAAQVEQPKETAQVVQEKVAALSLNQAPMSKTSLEEGMNVLSEDLAEAVARTRLKEQYPEAWESTVALARRAREVSGQQSLDSLQHLLLMNAAWLRFVAVSNSRSTGWERLDTVLLLSQWQLRPVAAAVLFAEAGRAEAQALDCELMLQAWESDPQPAWQALETATLTCGLKGKACEPSERLDLLRQQLGEEDYRVQALESYLENAVLSKGGRRESKPRNFSV